jgi:hypothetical protein
VIETERPMKLSALLILNAVLVCASPATSQMQNLGSKDTFAAARLSAKEIQEIVAEVEQSAYDTPDSWESELRVQRVDLGATPGIIAQGSKLLCGGTGNCQTWVFRKAGGKLISLMARDQVPIAEGFSLGPNVTGGIKDLSISSNTSADSGTNITYKFDGNFYRTK